MKAPSLSEWLKSRDLERFVEVFEENEVDLTTLRLLTESDLKELGLPFGPRKRILNLLAEEKALDKFQDILVHGNVLDADKRVKFTDLVRTEFGSKAK